MDPEGVNGGAGGPLRLPQPPPPAPAAPPTPLHGAPLPKPDPPVLQPPVVPEDPPGRLFELLFTAPLVFPDRQTGVEFEEYAGETKLLVKRLLV